jgi:hypothetical protein
MKTLARTLLALFLLAGSSCKKDSGTIAPSNTGTGGTITTGAAVEVARQTIPASGGTLIIRKAGDPLDGFEISVPSNSFNDAQDFVVSRSEITSHRLGPNFNPIGPLVTISSGGGYASGVLNAKVPIRLPAGHFAMGFFYDSQTGTLEPIPLEKVDSNYLVLSTRHFSPSAAGLGKSSRFTAGPALGQLVISSIEASLLEGQATISTGFTPGVDDWEFPNFGSYIASGGHCAGQSMTAIWYYYEKRLKGAPPLNARYDVVNDPANPGKLWADNPRGYRFASTVQEDLNFDNWMLNSLPLQSWVPTITYYSFLYAMLVTGEPQFVAIMNSVTNAGHAMIMYKASPVTGTLYIADPNYPGNRDPFTGTPTVRTIEYQNGTLKPYSSALFSGGPGTSFDQIGFTATTAYIEWPKIAQRWAEFEDGTIGNDRFPSYSLRVRSDGERELVDTLSTYSDTLTSHCQSLAAEQMIPGTDGYQEFWVYDGAGTFLDKGFAGNNGILQLALREGENKLGFFIMAARGGKYQRYVDFRWTRVTRLKSDIDFTRVKRIGMGLLSVMTHWKDSQGNPHDLAESPTWGADVTFSGNTLSGKSSLTGDSIWTTASNPASVRFFGKTRQTLGSLGSCQVTISGTISTAPEITPGDKFRYSATGEAVAAVVDSVSIKPGVSYTYDGWSFSSNSLFGITFEY